jgi:hypothetical protein
MNSQRTKINEKSFGSKVYNSQTKYYIRLVEGKGFLSALIDFKESDWVSHVELLQTDDSDVPIRVLSSRYPRGVQYRGYNDYPVCHDAWYTVKLPSDACERAWKTMETLIGLKYDLKDIFGIGLNTDWHADKHFICSEAVAWAFERIGCPLFSTVTAMSVSLHPEFSPYMAVRRIWPRDFLLTRVASVYKVVK